MRSLESGVSIFFIAQRIRNTNISTKVPYATLLSTPLPTFMMMASPIRLILPRNSPATPALAAAVVGAAASRPPSHPSPPSALPRQPAVVRIVRTKRRSSSAANRNGDVVGAFGLRPPDYSVLPPIFPSPPPPPAKPGLRRYLWVLTLGFSAASVGYFYVNNKNDNHEYW